MKKHLTLAVISLAAFLFFSNFSAAFAADKQIAPDFRLESIMRNQVTLSSFKGEKQVLLLFWTTWCPYCREQLMWLNDKYSQFSKQGLEILTINVGESLGRVERFVNLRKLTYPVLLDETSYVASLFEIMGVPTYVLVDKEGCIVFSENTLPEKKLESYLSK